MLRLMTDNDLEMVLKWRNLPEVRQMMFTQHEISWDEHQAWWNKTKQDKTKCWLIYSYDSVDVGVVNFYEIDRQNNHGEWGFYLGEDKLFNDANISKRRAWRKLEEEAIEFAREKLKLSKLICEVFEHNKSVQKLHEKMGFNKIEPKQTNKQTKQKSGQHNNLSVILLLGPYRPKIENFLISFGDELLHTEDKISGSSELLDKVDFIVSYGYRHLLTKDIIDKFTNKIINLHISLLPWNRGSDPNLWSFLENTPKGVTIHYLDEGIDTGDILAQKEVQMRDDDTLKTSYERLSTEIEQLFKIVWPEIREGKLKAIPQPKGGSFHRLRDKKAFEHLLTNGWDTPVANLIGKAQ